MASFSARANCGRIMSKHKCKEPCSWHEGKSPRWFHRPFGASGGRCSLKPFASAAALEAANRQTADVLQDSHAILRLLSGDLEAKKRAARAALEGRRSAVEATLKEARDINEEAKRRRAAVQAERAQRLAALAARRRSSNPPR
jgi:hypothetical protein